MKGGGQDDGSNELVQDSTDPPDWGACIGDGISFGIGVAGDLTIWTGGGLAIKGIVAARAGRTGLKQVATRAVRTGRGALTRTSRQQIVAGRNMGAHGGSIASAGWAGDGTLNSGLQQSLALSSQDDSAWDWVPFYGTGIAAVDAVKSCSAAIRASR